MKIKIEKLLPKEIFTEESFAVDIMFFLGKSFAVDITFSLEKSFAVDMFCLGKSFAVGISFSLEKSFAVDMIFYLGKTFALDKSFTFLIDHHTRQIKVAFLFADLPCMVVIEENSFYFILPGIGRMNIKNSSLIKLLHF